MLFALDTLHDKLQNLFEQKNSVDEHISFVVRDYSIRKNEIQLKIRPIRTVEYQYTNTESIPTQEYMMQDSNYVRMKNFVSYLSLNSVNFTTKETAHSFSFNIALDDNSIVVQELLEQKIISCINEAELHLNITKIECFAVANVKEDTFYLNEYFVIISL